MLDKKLFKLIGKNQLYIYIVVFLNTLELLANTSIIASIVWMLEKMTKFNDDYKIFLIPFIILISSIILRFILYVVSGKIKIKFGNIVKIHLRNIFYKKLLKLGIRSNEDIKISGLTQLSVEGIEQLDIYYTTYLPQFFYSQLAPIILFLITVFIDYRFSLVLIFSVPLIPISIIIVSKRAKKIFSKYWSKYISMGDKFLDSISGLKDIKILGYDKIQNENINTSAEDFRKITMKVLTMQLSSITIMDMVSFGGASLGILLSILSLKNGIITPFETLFLILVAVEFFLPLRALGSAFHVAMNGTSAGKKILDILNTDELKWGDKSVDKLDIALENVSFSYTDDKKILDNVCLNFKNKKITSIVGLSGSGKTTITKLILGQIRPQIGRIKIGDIDIYDLNRSIYYSNISLVSYNTYIFNDSVRNNFKNYKKDITDNEIKYYLEKVCLYDFILSNGGFDKKINEMSTNISGGQRQRLALAINLCANRSIYIFDEMTSNIDIESEEIIFKNIYEMSKDKTIILISHRLSNISKSDYIYVLKDSHVVEEGKHINLLEKNMLYADLYNKQKELENGYLEDQYE